jgi:hypothetical protein
MANKDPWDDIRASREESGYMEKWLREFHAEMMPTLEMMIRSMARDPEDCARRLQELRQQHAARLSDISQR